MLIIFTAFLIFLQQGLNIYKKNDIKSYIMLCLRVTNPRKVQPENEIMRKNLIRYLSAFAEKIKNLRVDGFETVFWWRGGTVVENIFFLRAPIKATKVS